MGTIKTTNIQSISGSGTVTLGTSGETLAAGSGVTIGSGLGKILQVVTATDATTRDTTSTSFVTGSNTLTLNITPASTSNKIFLMVNSVGYNSNGDDNSYTIYRGVTNLGGAEGMCYAQFGRVATFGAQGAVALSYLDSPSSTSSLTYQVYFKAESTGTAELGRTTVTSSITAFEVAG